MGLERRTPKGGGGSARAARGASSRFNVWGLGFRVLYSACYISVVKQPPPDWLLNCDVYSLKSASWAHLIPPKPLQNLNPIEFENVIADSQKPGVAGIWMR